ncbi:MAG: TldD/PmbA family protein [Firmicutes bacterium]|nr:TldD/PmbA family protein [Bacillota bacterium]
MKAKFSPYLTRLAQFFRELSKELSKTYNYVSILSTDSVGLNIRISGRSKSVSSETMTTERGNVVRVHQNGLYSEYAFNDLDLEEALFPTAERRLDYVRQMADIIRNEVNRQLELLKRTETTVYTTPTLKDEPRVLLVEKEAKILPEEADVAEYVERLTQLSERGKNSMEGVLDCSMTAQCTHICKMFITPNQYLRQSYVYAEGTAVLIAANEETTKFSYEGVSGLGGMEIFDGLEEKLEVSIRHMKDLLSSGRIEPGEYDIITAPNVTGLIAHEAFGHGVEMDMFVKNRALGQEYIGKRVGSDLVTMHEGALCAESVTGYAFDDEGTPAGDVIEIDHGILKTGICDALSALRLGIEPTGNGKRENYEHKVYTRMTNTVFDSGNDSLDDMIASISHGYLLEGMDSGMEDPKHWGIQCIISKGYEIRDGKLTGKVVSPVVMTGYVPDLLGSVSMASADRGIEGNGGCGKGYKEWVKVADGGPYLKARARLG